MFVLCSCQSGMDCYPGQPALQQSVVEGTREKGYDIRTVEGEGLYLKIAS